MTKYTAVAATTNKCMENWGGTSEFTDEALSQLAETAPGKLVLLDFNPEKRVGVVLSAKNDNGKLIIEVDINAEFIVHEPYRIVPGFIAHKDDWENLDSSTVHRIIKNAESVDYGITTTPTEQGLPEIKPTK